MEALAGDLAAGELALPSVRLRLACLQAAAGGLGAQGGGGWAPHALARLGAAAGSLAACAGPERERTAIASGTPRRRGPPRCAAQRGAQARARAGLVETAAALARPPGFPPAAAGALLAALPAACLAPGEPLGARVRGTRGPPARALIWRRRARSRGARRAAGWLLGGAGEHGAWLLDGLCEEQEALFEPAPGAPPGATVAAAEVGAWAERAQRLARLMAMGAEVDAPAGARALDGLQARMLALHARPYLARGVAERALLLLAALLQVPPRARAPRRTASPSCPLGQALRRRARAAGHGGRARGGVPAPRPGPPVRGVGRRIGRLREHRAAVLLGAARGGGRARARRARARPRPRPSRLARARARADGRLPAPQARGGGAPLPAPLQAAALRAQLALDAAALALLAVLHGARFEQHDVAAERAARALHAVATGFCERVAAAPIPGTGCAPRPMRRTSSPAGRPAAPTPQPAQGWRGRRRAAPARACVRGRRVRRRPARRGAGAGRPPGRRRLPGRPGAGGAGGRAGAGAPRALARRPPIFGAWAATRARRRRRPARQRWTRSAGARWRRCSGWRPARARWARPRPRARSRPRPARWTRPGRRRWFRCWAACASWWRARRARRAACRPRWARWACRRGRARATASCWRPCWRRCCARPGRPWPTPGARSPPAASPPPSWSSRSRRSSSSWQTRPAGARPARRRRAPACPPARPRQQPTTSAVWRRAALHGPGGPLQWAAAQLLDVGARSPTTAALTALHLSALWLRCPQAAPAYVGAWLRLLLLSHADHGSAGHQPGLQVAPAPRPRPRRPPNPKPCTPAALKGGGAAAQDAMQAGQLSAEARAGLDALPAALRAGYAATGLAARVAAVAAAHELGRLAGRRSGGPDAAPADRAAAGAPRTRPGVSQLRGRGGGAERGAHGAGAAGEALWAGVRAEALGVPPERTGRYLSAGRRQRERVRAFQALAVLACFAPDADVGPTLDAVWACLQARRGRPRARAPPRPRARARNVYGQNYRSSSFDETRRAAARAQVDEAPSVRQFEEAVCLALLLRRPGRAPRFLLPRLDPARPRSEGVAPLALVGLQLLLHAPAARDALLRPFFAALLPWAMNHNHTLRCGGAARATPLHPAGRPAEAHASARAARRRCVCQLALHELLRRFPGLADGAPVAGVAAFLDGNADMRKLRGHMGAGMLAFDPAAATSPLGVFYTARPRSPDRSTPRAPGGGPRRAAARRRAGRAHDGARRRRCAAGGSARVAGGVRDRLPGGRARRAASAARPGQCRRAARRACRAQRASPAPLPSRRPLRQRRRAQKLRASRARAARRSSASPQPRMRSQSAAVRLCCQPALVPWAALEQAKAVALGSPPRRGRLRPAAGRGADARPPASRAGPDEARRRHDIVVAASLIDKVPNMGGLARTCEVRRPPRPPAHGGRRPGAPEGAARAPAGVWRGGARAARPQGAARARLPGGVHDGRAVGARAGGAGLRAAGLAAAAPRRRLRARRPGAGAPPPARVLACLRAGRARQRAAPAQAAEAQPLPAFRWPRRVVLVLGHEVFGIPADILQARALSSGVARGPYRAAPADAAARAGPGRHHRHPAAGLHPQPERPRVRSAGCIRVRAPACAQGSSHGEHGRTTPVRP